MLAGGRAPTTSPRICMAWWEGYRTSFQGTGPVAQGRARNVRIRTCEELARNPALPNPMHMPAPAPTYLHLYSWSVSQGAGCWALGRRVRRYHRRGFDQSVLGRCGRALASLAVQDRASHSCIKAPPEPLVFIMRLCLLASLFLFYSFPLPNPHLHEDWLGLDWIALFPLLCA